MTQALETLFFDQPWAILRQKLDTMARVTMERKLSDVDILQKLEALEQRAIVPSRPSGGSIAVLPLYGLITQRLSIFSLLFGGTSTEGQQFPVSQKNGEDRELSRKSFCA
jgi:hypothetical protein